MKEKPEIIRIDVMPKRKPGDVQEFQLMEQEYPPPRPKRVTMEELDQELIDLEERKQEIIELKEQISEKVFEVLKAMKEGGM